MLGFAIGMIFGAAIATAAWKALINTQEGQEWVLDLRLDRKMKGE